MTEQSLQLHDLSFVPEGDEVVVGRHAGLKDGDKVQPRMSDTQAK